jgi:hypothetical protein
LKSIIASQMSSSAKISLDTGAALSVFLFDDQGAGRSCLGRLESETTAAYRSSWWRVSLPGLRAGLE